MRRNRMRGLLLLMAIALPAPSSPEGLGMISGKVTDQLTGDGLPDTRIQIWDDEGRFVRETSTLPSGSYVAGELLPGVYFVTTASSTGYFNEAWDDLFCDSAFLFPRCDVTAAAPVEVALDSTTSGIDFALVLGGSIEGTVTAAGTGERLEWPLVEIFDASGTLVVDQHPGQTGTFRTSLGLLAGTYFVRTRHAYPFLDELYDDIPCPSTPWGVAECDPTTGDPIAVALGATAGNVDFVLRRGGHISGTVTEEGTGAPLFEVGLAVYDAQGLLPARAVTDFAGRYVTPALLPGTYFVQTESLPGYTESLPGYVHELFDDIPCPGPACIPVAGTPVQVALESTTTGIDFALALGRGIRGTITDETSGLPLRDVAVDVWDGSGSLHLRVYTDSDGRYTVGLEEPGVYFVSTDNGQGAVDEIYDDVACPDGSAGSGLCDPLTGTPIAIDTTTVRDDVDFALAGARCVETGTALCLSQGRFRVEVDWQAPDGSRGSGRAFGLTSETGYFWFFAQNNVEMVVKVLDGCFEPFDTFWVFAAGLTDAAVELTVTDTLAGVVNTYENPLGTAFEPILDTQAFATCSAGVRQEPARDRKRGGGQPSVGRELAGREKGVCVASDTALCIGEDRFLVETFWRTPKGETGQGRAVTLTDDTGYFWFFSADNVEVVVKVLDACGLDTFENFWVFAAGLTDVEVRLRVTDTASGEVNEYLNPLGSAFAPVADTSAFDTCPP